MGRRRCPRSPRSAAAPLRRTWPATATRPPDPPGTLGAPRGAPGALPLGARARPERAGGARLGRAHRPPLGLRPPRRDPGPRDQLERLLPGRQVARPGEGAAYARGRRGGAREHHPRGIRRLPVGRQPRDRPGCPRRVLEGLRRPRAAGRAARALPLGRLREAGSLRGKARVPGGPGAARLGRARRVRAGGRRPPLHARAAGGGAGRGGGSGALRLGGRAASERRACSSNFVGVLSPSAARIRAWSGSSTSTTHPGGRPACRRPTCRWRRGCARSRSASSWARSTCSAAAPRCAPRSRRAAPTR